MYSTIPYMSKRQLSISLSKNMLPVIAEAREAFPDVTTDSQALTRALFHWYHGRQENSKRGALDRIEKKLDFFINEIRPKHGIVRIEQELAEMKLMLSQLLGGSNAPDY